LFTDVLDLNSYTAFCTLLALVYQVIGGSLSEVLIGLGGFGTVQWFSYVKTSMLSS